MITKKKFMLVLIDTLILLFILLLSSLYPLAINTLSWLSFIVVFYVLVTLLPIRKGEGVSFSFILIYSLVIFGRVILKYVFNYIPAYDFFDTFSIFTNTSLAKALLLGLYSLLALHTGMMLVNNKLVNDPEKLLYNNNNNIEVKAIKTTSALLFFVAIIPSGLNYVTNFTQGYGSIIEDNIDTTLGLMAGLMFPVFIILILVERKKWAYIAGVLYYFPQLFWGARGEPILQIVTLTFLYFKYINKKKIGIGKKILLMLGGIIVLNLFNIIKEMRKLPANIWLNDLPSLFVDSFVNSNPILEVVYEIGIALAPTAAAIEYVPSLINVQYGKTILYSITTAVPDVFNIRPQVMSIYGNVGSLLSTQADSQFGASILQDFFVNFMWATPFFMLIVGFLVKKFSRKLAYEGDFVKLVFYSSLIYPVLWWPRSSLSYILRYFFTAVVIPMLLYYFLKKIYYQREKAHKS